MLRDCQRDDDGDLGWLTPCVQKHFDLNIIATALGAPNAKQTYPNERYVKPWSGSARVLPSHHIIPHYIPSYQSASEEEQHEHELNRSNQK